MEATEYSLFSFLLKFYSYYNQRFANLNVISMIINLIVQPNETTKNYQAGHESGDSLS